MKKALAETVQSDTTRKTEEPAVKKISVQAQDKFDEQKVISVFETYIQLHHPETTVTIALKSHKPEINGDAISVEIDNKLQLEKLEVIKLQLQNLLIKRLNNGCITLSFKFFDNSDGKEAKKLYTAQDKFEHFVEINPVVMELKNIFGLELD